MSQSWKAACIVAAATVSIIGIILLKKKRRSFVRVGKISKLYFFPVKSLKAIEVKKGKCTKLGFEVNGILDRSFMLIDNEKVVTQREAPSLALVSAHIDGKTLCISAPTGETLKVQIKESVDPEDTVVQRRIHSDNATSVDCGHEAASFFQSYLDMPDIRLVQHFPSLPRREHLTKNEFQRQLRKDNPIGFQDLTPIHLMSEASIDDLNSKLEGKKVSVLNFRPNILVAETKPFAEDSWLQMKFTSGVLLCNLTLISRCILTTNDPFTGIITKKEPLVTLRKYRIPKDKEDLKKTGPLPCLGIGCAVWETGDVSVGDDVFADVGRQPAMVQK